METDAKVKPALTPEQWKPAANGWRSVETQSVTEIALATLLLHRMKP